MRFPSAVKEKNHHFDPEDAKHVTLGHAAAMYRQ
jgi:hypothetical protein